MKKIIFYYRENRKEREILFIYLEKNYKLEGEKIILKKKKILVFKYLKKFDSNRNSNYMNQISCLNTML